MTKSERLILLKKIRADRKLAVAKDLSGYQEFIFKFHDPDYAGTGPAYISKSDRKQDLDIEHHGQHHANLKEENG